MVQFSLTSPNPRVPCYEGTWYILLTITKIDTFVITNNNRHDILLIILDCVHW